MAKLINDFTVNINFDVEYSTVKTCLALVESYLNQHDTEYLVIENNEPGAWNLVIRDWR